MNHTAPGHHCLSSARTAARAAPPLPAVSPRLGKRVWVTALHLEPSALMRQEFMSRALGRPSNPCTTWGGVIPNPEEVSKHCRRCLTQTKPKIRSELAFTSMREFSYSCSFNRFLETAPHASFRFSTRGARGFCTASARGTRARQPSADAAWTAPLRARRSSLTLPHRKRSGENTEEPERLGDLQQPAFPIIRGALGTSRLHVPSYSPGQAAAAHVTGRRPSRRSRGDPMGHPGRGCTSQPAPAPPEIRSVLHRLAFAFNRAKAAPAPPVSPRDQRRALTSKLAFLRRFPKACKEVQCTVDFTWYGL